MVGVAASFAATPGDGAPPSDWLVVSIVYGAVVAGVVLCSLFPWWRRARDRRRLMARGSRTPISRDPDPGVRRFADAVARGDFEAAERTASWIFFMKDLHTDTPPGDQSRRPHP